MLASAQANYHSHMLLEESNWYNLFRAQISKALVCIPSYPESLFLPIYSKELVVNICKDHSTNMFIVVLLTIVKIIYIQQ